MKLASVHTIIAAALLLVLFISPLAFLTLLLAWCVISIIAAALAYTLNWAMIFRKNKNGSIPATMRWILTPYLVYVSIYNRIKRYRDPVPSMQKIIDNLYVGARLRPADINSLLDDKINAVLDVTAEFDGLGSFADEHRNIEYLNIPVLDHAVPKQSQLLLACRWIHERRQKGKSVLVHCALGRGRSVLFVSAYLITIGKSRGLADALSHITGVRHTARLNRRQTRKMEIWLKQDLGKLNLRERACIIANPVAGGGKWKETSNEILQTLSPFYLLEVLETTPDVSAGELAEQVLKQDYDIVIACGGDGTLNQVVNIIAGTGIPLGLIPLGTANSLVRALFGWQSSFIPIQACCQAITAGDLRKIDTAICNNERMLLALGLGMEEFMVHNANRDEKNRFGQFAYLQGFFNSLGNTQPVAIKVSFDNEETQEIGTKSFMVANAAPATTILAQGKGQPDYDDGYLDVTWLEIGDGIQDDVAALGRLTVSAISNSSPGDHQVLHKQAKILTIQSETPLQYVIDGETREADSISIELDKHSLSVFLPLAGKQKEDEKEDAFEKVVEVIEE